MNHSKISTHVAFDMEFKTCAGFCLVLEVNILSLQVEMMQSEVRDKEEENSALQREMSAARQKHEEATQALVG